MALIFLTNDDFGVQIRTQILNTINQSDPTKTERAELDALAEMKSYLNGRYDTALIFGVTGTNRNAQIVMYCIDILLYHLHSNISPNNVPELREKRYEQAISWLKMVAANKLNPNLPIVEGQEGGNFVGGSNKKGSSRW